MSARNAAPHEQQAPILFPVFSYRSIMGVPPPPEAPPWTWCPHVYRTTYRGHQFVSAEVMRWTGDGLSYVVSRLPVDFVTHDDALTAARKYAEFLDTLSPAR